MAWSLASLLVRSPGKDMRSGDGDPEEIPYGLYVLLLQEAIAGGLSEGGRQLGLFPPHGLMEKQRCRGSILVAQGRVRQRRGGSRFQPVPHFIHREFETRYLTMGNVTETDLHKSDIQERVE